jgi:hypothetical protein
MMGVNQLGFISQSDGKANPTCFNNHALVQVVSSAIVTCDLCQESMIIGSNVFICRPCSFDVCTRCFSSPNWTCASCFSVNSASNLACSRCKRKRTASAWICGNCEATSYGEICVMCATAKPVTGQFACLLGLSCYYYLLLIFLFFGCAGRSVSTINSHGSRIKFSPTGASAAAGASQISQVGTGTQTS